MEADLVEPRARVGTAKKKAIFVEALAVVLGVAPAAAAAGIDRRTAYKWKAADPTFAEAWDNAQQSCVDKLEARHVESAMAKDTLARIHLLRSHRRDIYGERVEIKQQRTDEIVIRLELSDHVRLAAAAAELLAPKLALPVLEAELVKAKLPATV